MKSVYWTSNSLTTIRPVSDASALNPAEPLDVVQIDHTSIDVIVVDEQDRRPLGRPCLTLAIDVATRVVLKPAP